MGNLTNYSGPTNGMTSLDSVFGRGWEGDIWEERKTATI